ncbi:MAG: FAD-binding oxidoreductase [Pseudomonadota bacterium]
MELIEELSKVVGSANVLTGADTARYARDWTGAYEAEPLAVVRPGNTAEVSAAIRLAAVSGVSVVPVSGNTGLTGGSHAPGALMISVERLNQIRDIRTASRIAVVGAGVVISQLHEAAADHGLAFPVTFGAKGSAMIGGILSTNAGGSNVLRYGSTRAQCLGLEVVLASGEVLNLMSALHKDNSGYDLKDLFIGAEGTLGLITAAVVKLIPQPTAYATAMVATADLDSALDLLNQLQEVSGGAVEAFEYMPGTYMEAALAVFPKMRPPFEARHDTNLLIEIGLSPNQAQPDDTGAIPGIDSLEQVLGELLGQGRVLDAVIAQSDAQRTEMWERREAAAEVSLADGPLVNNDIAVPVDQVSTFLTRAQERLDELVPNAIVLTVSHLGDGNVHYTVRPPEMTPELADQIMEAIEDVVLELGGSFSAEHGIGLSKRSSMKRRKDPVALEVMTAIKAALDPQNLMNPGKVLPS